MSSTMNNNENGPRGRVTQEGRTMNDQQETGYQQSTTGADQQIPPGGFPYPVAAQLERSRRKSPLLATLLSCFPGLGQIYVGYYQTGFLFGLTVAGTIGVLNTSLGGGGLEPFLGVFLSFFWIFNMIDANRRAQHYNLVLSGKGGETIPEDFPTAGRGSVPTGVVLVVVGVLFILDLNFGVSLEWLENWWPLSLVGFGAWLILKGRQRED